MSAEDYIAGLETTCWYCGAENQDEAPCGICGEYFCDSCVEEHETTHEEEE